MPQFVYLILFCLLLLFFFLLFSCVNFTTKLHKKRIRLLKYRSKYIRTQAVLKYAHCSSIYTVLFTAYIEKPAHKIINNIMYKGTLEKNKKKTWRFLSPFGKIPAREKKN